MSKYHTENAGNIFKCAWNRWKKEYLPTLTTIKEKDNLQVSELLLLRTDTSRGQWPLSIITESIAGRDNRIRMAYVKTHNGTCLRPTSKNYKLKAPNAR